MSLRRKKGKKKNYEDWKPTEDLFGICDPRDFSKQETQESSRTYTVWNDRAGKFVPEEKDYVVKKSVPEEANSLEITKSGYVRTPAEVEGVYRAKVKARKSRKQKIFRERKVKDKKRDLERRGVTSVKEEKQVETQENFKRRMADKTKQKQAQAVKTYTKEEKQDFRKFMQRRKDHKKAKKKARQAVRKSESKPQTESGLASILEGYEDGLDNNLSNFIRFLENNGLRTDNAVIGFQYVNLIYQIYNAPSACYAMSVVTNFVTLKGVSVDDCIGMCKDIARIFTENRVETESLSEFLDKGRSILSDLATSSVLDALRRLIVLTVGAGIFTKDQENLVYTYFDPLPKAKMTVVGVIDMVLNSLSIVTAFVERIWHGDSISKALLSADPYKVVVAEASNLLMYGNRLYYGLPEPDKMCAKMFINQAVRSIDDMKTVKKRVSPLTAKYGKLSETLVKLQDLYDTVSHRLNRSSRPTPIGVVVAGDPGIGKSSVTNFVYQTHSFVKGRVFEYCHVFERVVSSQYWDGYGAGTPYIHYSEVGSLAKQTVRNRGDPAVSELTSVIDSMPFCCDMSDVKDKGKVFCNAEMVVIDTNNADMNIDLLTQNPAAYRRRFLYIEPLVKKKYRKDVGNALDPEKCHDGSNYYDKWTFDVYVMEPNGLTNSIKRYLLKHSDDNSDIYGLEEVLKTYFVEKIKQGEREVMSKEENYYDLADEKAYSEVGEIFDYARMGVNMSDVKDYIEYNIHEYAWIFSFIVASIAGILEFVTLFFVTEFCPDSIIYVISGLLFLLWLGGHVSITLLVICFCLTRVNKYRITKAFLKKRMERGMSNSNAYIRCALRRSVSICRSYIGEVTPGWVNSPADAGRFAQIGIALSGLLWLYCSMKKKRNDSNHYTEDGSIEDIDTMFDCGNSYPRIRTKHQKIWNTVKLEPSVHISDIESLHKLVSRNARRVVIVDGNKRYKTFCLGLCKNLALINKHALGLLSERTVLHVSVKGGYSDTDGYHTTLLYNSEVVPVHSDIVLIALSGVSFKDIRIHFPGTTQSFTNAKSMIGTSSTVARGILPSLEVVDDRVGLIVLEDVVTYDWNDHEKGSCGLPLVGKRDAGSCIIGLHSAGSSDSARSYAVAVSRVQINRAIDLYETKNPNNYILSEAGRTGVKMPHFKSPVYYEDLGSINYYGSLHDVSLRQKSNLKKTVFRPHLDRIFFDKFNYVRQDRYIPPLMQPVGSGDSFLSPYNIALRKMALNKKVVDRHALRVVQDVIVNQLISNLKNCDIPVLKPLTLHTALNGADNDPFIRRIDVNKAAGYGFPGKKRDYLTRYEEEGKIYDVPNPELVDEIKEILSSYSEGRNYGPVYKATLKDEPRLVEKVVTGKTRVFFASPFAHLIVSRMFLAPFYSLMVEFSEQFYCALGVDMHREGHLIYARLSSFSESISEGDYSGYDTSMPSEIAEAAGAIVIQILDHFGYTEEQLVIVKGLMSDNVFPYVDFIGELMCVAGLQPSGKYATAEDNSLKGLIIMVYLWTVSGRDPNLFFDNVLPCLYGDDMLAAVKDENFGSKTYSKLASEHLGMKFTASDKGDVEKEFIHPSEMSFLKRTFIYSDLLGRIVCPLAMDSIYRALEWRLPSVLNEPTQMEQTLSSMAYELFLHNTDDRMVFEDGMRELVLVLQDSYPGCVFSIPSFSDVLTSLSLDPDEKPVTGGRRDVDISITTESGVSGWDEDINSDNTDMIITFGRVMDINQWSANKIGMIEDQVMLLGQELKEVEEKLQNLADPMPGLTLRQIKQLPMYSADLSFKNNVDNYYEIKSAHKALEASLNRLWAFLRREKYQHIVVTESGEVSAMTNDIKENVTDNHENIVEIAGDAPDHETTPIYRPLAVGQTNKLQINDFLSRPLAVTSFSVAVGSDVNYVVDLWDYFLSHPSIRSKIRNYAYLRANMNFRISISATPFHYSKVLVSYQPLAGFNKNLEYLDTTLGGAARFQALSYLSQSKWSKVIDVKSNAPLEMQVPFISPQPMLRLYNDSPLILPDTASFNDAVGFGKLYIQSINPVQCASATPTSISVFLYAFMDNVELGAPTGTVIDIGTESGEDERKIGPVEDVATRAYQITSRLSDVPVIGPYAKASTVVLKNMASLSSLFGFSVPTMDNEPLRVKQQPYQNGANVIGYDTGKRLTLDPKQELSVDPRLTGTEEDEMSLSYLCQHEALLDTFSWTDGTAPLSSSIWMAPINPGIVAREPLGVPTPYLVVPTPLSLAASFFDVWRGDIDLRFEINCSKYHRGKLAFYFEPNIAQNVVIDTILDMNKQSIKIIDIQETQDVSFRIKWAFPRAWAKVISSDLLGDLGSVGFLGANLFNYANGYIAVTPFTALQSPDGSNISINVYISSPDMKFNQMVSNRLPTTRPTTESGRLSPEEVRVMELNPSTATQDYISEVHYGEQPTSFRSLMKRFASAINPSDTSVTINPGRAYIYYREGMIYPEVAPRYDGATATTLNIYSQLRYAYLGIKGGVRRRLSITGDLNFREGQMARIKLAPPSTTVTTSYSTDNVMARMSSSIGGTLTYVPHTNGGVEFELPNYTNNLFGISFSDDPYPSTSIIEGELTRGFFAILPVYPGPSSTWATLTDVHIIDDFATAEDFSLFLFSGSPAFIYT